MSIAINNVPTREQYSATAGQTVFNVPFPFYNETYLRVYQRAPADEPDNTTQLLTLGVDYSVSGEGLEAGGTVTLTVGAPLNDIITIFQAEPIDRTSVFDDINQFTVSMNRQLNELTIMTQQLNTFQNELIPKYRYDELISDNVRQDNLQLPILNDGYIWIGRGNYGDDPDDIQAALLSSLIPGGGGGTTTQVEQPNHSLSFGQWVRIDSSGDYVPALSTTTTGAESWWVVTTIIDNDNFIITEVGYVDLTGCAWGPFTPGDAYFISDTTPGEAVNVDVTTEGYVSKPCFIARTTTAGHVIQARGQIQGASAGGGGSGGAPIDATYVTLSANATLTNEFSLGTLTTGLVLNTVAAGVSTLTTAANGTDYYGPGLGTPIPVAEGGTGATSFTQYEVVVGDATTLKSLGSTGTAGQVLTSTGNSSDPSWQAPAGGAGGTEVATSGAVSGVASIDFDDEMNSTYDYYEVKFVCGTVGTDDVALYARVGTTGAVYQTTNYNYAYDYYSASTATGSGGSSGLPAYYLTASAGAFRNIGSAAGESVTTILRIYCPSSTSLYKNMHAVTDYNEAGATSGPSCTESVGMWKSTTAITSVQIYASSGTISGTATLYGYNL